MRRARHDLRLRAEIASSKIGRRFPGARPRPGSQAVLADDAIDAIAIATPVSTHFPLASAALEAGKHVFIEKPLAASSAECLELIRLASERARRPHARPYVPLQPSGRRHP